jgi:ubiquitin carboxyl-terminal hydrolase L5
VHNSFARSSPFVNEAQKLPSEDDDVYHFIAYSSINRILYELDGLQPAPISHGRCEFEDFPTKIIPILQQRINSYPKNEIRFNLMAAVRDLRLRARETGDDSGLEREEQKRNLWQWENSLRRHNLIGFISEMLKGVALSKIRHGDEEYNEWINELKANAQLYDKKDS